MVNVGGSIRGNVGNIGLVLGGSLDGGEAFLQESKSGQAAGPRVSRVSRVGHVEPATWRLVILAQSPRGVLWHPHVRIRISQSNSFQLLLLW